MTRLAPVFWLLLVVSAAVATFAVKYRVQALTDQLAQTTKAADAQERELRVLNAEWAYLNRPETLAQMNQRFLSLEPITTKQLQTAIADIPMRPTPPPAPAPVAPAPAAPPAAAALGAVASAEPVRPEAPLPGNSLPGNSPSGNSPSGNCRPGTRRRLRRYLSNSRRPPRRPPNRPGLQLTGAPARGARQNRTPSDRPEPDRPPDRSMEDRSIC